MSAIPSWPHPLIADDPVLDFVDTWLHDQQGRPLDRLQSYDDLVGFARASGLLDDAAAVAALKTAGHGGEQALARARELRAALRRAADALANQQPVPAELIETINPLLQRQGGYHELVPAAVGARGVLGERYVSVIRSAEDVLIPLAQAAREFFVFKDPALVKRCANREGCTHVFYDTTKNHSRRWCSMSGCGNVAKATAFRKRRQRTAAV